MKPWFEKSLTEFKKLQNKLPHALIISGNKNIGKLEFTQIIVKELTGTDITNDNLDNDSSEILIRKSNYANLVYCKKEFNKSQKIATNINVEQIRKFNEFIVKTSQGIRIGIIYYADQLSNNAANALLKTLEEPRKNSLIILLTHNIKLLPITLISRCSKLHLSTDISSIEWIKNNINAKFEEEEIKSLLEENNYVPQIVVNKINNQDYKLEQELKNNLINMAINPCHINKIDLDNAELLIVVMQNLLLNIIRLKTSGTINNNKYYQHIITITKAQFLFNLLDDINYAKYLLTTTINQKLVLNSLLIIWSHITNLKKYPEIFSAVRE